MLTATSLATLGVAIAIALAPLGRTVGFTVLPVSLLAAVAGIACAYLVAAEVTKNLAGRYLHRIQ